MKSNRINENGMCLDEYEQNSTFAEVYYRRAIGELPEMECAVAEAELINQNFENNCKILDVGCACGHYYRSFKRIINKDFFYLGIDPYDILLDKAKLAWEGDPKATFKKGDIHNIPVEDSSYDYVVCNNVITHVPSLNIPISELLRVTKKRLIIHTTVSDVSFRVKMVYNNKWWKFTDVSPENEFDENGQPRAYTYCDIISKDYLNSLVYQSCPNAQIKYIEDTFYDAERINQAADREGMIRPTRVINDKQLLYGVLLLNHTFVDIEL